jgi:hypothetical protein
MTEPGTPAEKPKRKRRRRGRTGAALREAQRAKQAKRDGEYSPEELDAAYGAVADAILAGKTRFTGEDELIAHDIAFHALQDFIKDLGDTSNLDALDRAVLRFAGVDPDDPRTWPEDIHIEKRRRERESSARET